MRRVALLLWLLTLGCWLAANHAHAAFVLDDFNDSVSVTSPESDNQWAITDDVGPLNATRHVRIASIMNSEDFPNR
jgi:hypothetical protein